MALADDGICCVWRHIQMCLKEAANKYFTSSRRATTKRCCMLLWTGHFISELSTMTMTVVFCLTGLALWSKLSSLLTPNAIYTHIQSPGPGLSNNTCRIEEIVPGQTATFYKNLTVGEAGAHKRISFNCMEDIGGEFNEEPQWFKKALEDKCDQPGDDAGLSDWPLLKSPSYLVISNLVTLSPS